MNANPSRATFRIELILFHCVADIRTIICHRYSIPTGTFDQFDPDVFLIFSLYFAALESKFIIRWFRNWSAFKTEHSGEVWTPLLFFQ
jgi:hypothetical protein